MKTIITGTTCTNAFASDYPASFYVILTERSKERIRFLKRVVDMAGVNSIEEFWSDAVWSNDVVDIENVVKDVYEINTLMEDMDEKAARVDYCLLKVTDSDFSWEAVPRHCNADMATQSMVIPLSALEEEGVYIDIN